LSQIISLERLDLPFFDYWEDINSLDKDINWHGNYPCHRAMDQVTDLVPMFFYYKFKKLCPRIRSRLCFSSPQI